MLPVLILREARGVVRLAVPEGLQGIGQLCLALGGLLRQGGPAVRQCLLAVPVLPPAVVQLGSRVGELGFGRVQLFLGVGELRPGVIQFPFRLVQLRPGGGELRLTRPVLRPAVVQLLPAVDELPDTVKELGLALRQLVPLGLDGIQGLLPVLDQLRMVGLHGLQPVPGRLQGLLRGGAQRAVLRQGGHQFLQLRDLSLQLGDGLVNGLVVRQGGLVQGIPGGGQGRVRVVKEGLDLRPGLRVLREEAVHQRLRGLPQGDGHGPQLLLELGHPGRILRLSGLQLPPSGGQLSRAGLILGKAVFILRLAVPELRQGLLILPLAVLPLGKTLGVGGLVFVQRCQGVRQLLLRVGELLPGLGGLLRQGLLPVPIVPPAVIQLPPGVLELAPGVGELLLRLGPGVVQLPLGVRQFLIGLVHDGLPPQGRPDLRQLLQLRQRGIHNGLVGVREGHLLRRALHREVGGGVVIHGKGALGKAEEGRGLPGAEGGGPPLQADVEGGLDHAHHGELRPGQRIRIGPLGPQVQGVADDHVHLGEHQPVHHALVLRLRHPAVQQGQLVQFLGQGVDLHHGVAALGVRLHGGGEGVDEIDPLGPLHRGLRRHGVDVLPGEAQGGEHLHVHELRLVHISIEGPLHVRRRGPEAGEKGHRQRRQDKDREEAALAVLHLPQEILLQCPHVGSSLPEKSEIPHHSISATGVG